MASTIFFIFFKISFFAMLAFIWQFNSEETDRKYGESLKVGHATKKFPRDKPEPLQCVQFV